MLVDPKLKSSSKIRLLAELEATNKALIELLSEPGFEAKKVVVPWSEEPMEAINFLWGLESHETLHQGWNLAVMDHLNIERFPALEDMLG